MSRTTDIYTEHYADAYPALYIAPWRRKHNLNLQNLDRLISSLEIEEPSWLDMACGQAWHFRQFGGRARMIGLDLSLAQLKRARLNAPDASFLCADALAVPLQSHAFDLVTNFWAGYCYLGGEVQIAQFLESACECLKPGGTFYMEVLLAHDLSSFNFSNYATNTGFCVEAISTDFIHWAYEDLGGRHVMTSPELSFFEDRLSPRFDWISTKHDGAFMVHLIATGFKG